MTSRQPTKTLPCRWSEVSKHCKENSSLSHAHRPTKAHAEMVALGRAHATAPAKPSIPYVHFPRQFGDDALDAQHTRFRPNRHEADSDGALAVTDAPCLAGTVRSPGRNETWCCPTGPLMTWCAETMIEVRCPGADICRLGDTVTMLRNPTEGSCRRVRSS